jgi:hypothetical protein
VLFRLEGSEARGTISLRAMSRVAQAMDCKVVYALIPSDGTTLEEMAGRRKWKKRLEEDRDQGIGNRDLWKPGNSRSRLCVEHWEPMRGLPCIS